MTTFFCYREREALLQEARSFVTGGGETGRNVKKEIDVKKIG